MLEEFILHRNKFSIHIALEKHEFVNVVIEIAIKLPLFLHFITLKN